MSEGIQMEGLRMRPVRTLRMAVAYESSQFYGDERRRNARNRLKVKSDIDKGLTKAQRKAVEAYENQHRYDTTERVAAFDRNGRIIGQSISGSERTTELPDGNYKDSVITHNHPSAALDKSTPYGTSLSKDDIFTAAYLNAAAIRAVGGEFTYSIRRPKGGWPSDSVMSDLYYEWKSLWDVQRAESDKYMSAAKDYADKVRRKQRATTIAAHRINRKLAKKYGFEYTRRRTRIRFN